MKDIQNSIETLIVNSEQKLEAANLLAKSGDFSTSTAILVTAFEEKSKAVILQFVDLGYQLVNEVSDLDYIFKQHDARHYIGFFVDCIYEVMSELKAILYQFMTDVKFADEILNFLASGFENPEIEKQINDWLKRQISSFIEKTTFYKAIETTRQNGLYMDVLAKGGVKKKIDKEDYLFVKNRLNTIHLLSKDIKELKDSNHITIIESIVKSKQNIIQQKMPDHISSSLLLIKSKRNKGFNKIKQTLNEMLDEYFPDQEDSNKKSHD
jgi:AbiV family abortive infection protein